VGGRTSADCVGRGVETGDGDGLADGAGDSTGPGVEPGDAPADDVGSAPRAILTVAPDDDVDRVVIEMPLTGSANVLPATSGASPKLVVTGVESTSCD
jgi:hypothetical protein